jgi:hypothetical protein
MNLLIMRFPPTSRHFFRLESCGSGWGPEEGSCEHGNEPSSSLKCWGNLKWLSDWFPLKKGSIPKMRQFL